jgi:histidinol-phosphate aminotransferase
MKKKWFEKKTKEFLSRGGYEKPELQQGSLKLDSNENYVISKQFQSELISEAKKNSDVREYPLG